MAPVGRIDGYAPIADYAAIGDGRTVALVARDGAIDWLCLPTSTRRACSVRSWTTSAGCFELRPDEPFESTRRYLPGSNVLETTFSTTGGKAGHGRMTLPTGGLAPYRELVRRVEGLSGQVPMRWRVEPRPEYGSSVRLAQRAGVPVATHGRDAVAVIGWDAGDPTVRDGAIAGSFVAGAGHVADVVLAAAHQEPLVFPSREQVSKRLSGTECAWREWHDGRTYDGRWSEAVLRSALALKLLVFAPSGAIAAAPSTSLPETLGGERNWDYRFSWPRDSSFAVRALLALGCSPEANAFFSWLLHATQLLHPDVSVLYRLNGRTEADERTLRSPAIAAPGRSGSGTGLPVRLSSMSMVRSSMPRATWPAPPAISTAIRPAAWPRSQITSARSGARPTPASGRFAPTRLTSRSRR